MLLSSCEKKFANFLRNSRLLQEGAMIAGEVITNEWTTFSYVLLMWQLIAIDSVTNEHLDNVAKTTFSEWRKTTQYPYKLYSITSKPKDIPSE